MSLSIIIPTYNEAKNISISASCIISTNSTDTIKIKIPKTIKVNKRCTTPNDENQKFY
jgi:glycosyltransferase involved in cell wall biosynthesis